MSSFFTHWPWLLLLCIPLLIQWVYFIGYFSTLLIKSKSKTSTADEPVSIIVCAKNEAANLEKLVPILCSQNHPCYEVIIVNDGSWDDSHMILEAFKKNYPHLITLYLDPEKKLFSGKKLAITLGIKAAKYDIIQLIDADCMPASKDWLSLMQKSIAPTRPLALGYSPYYKAKGLLNLFIRFETQITAMLYLSKAKKGKPYMGVGRNMTYTKKSFFDVKGFANHHHIISGDDDLHVQNLAQIFKANIVLSPNSFVYSHAKPNFDQWAEQKRRHLQVGKFYQSDAKWFVGVFMFSNLIFLPIAILLLIFLTSLWQMIVAIVIARYLINGTIFSLCSKKLADTSTIIFYPLLDFLIQVYWIGFGIYVFFTKKKGW